MAEIFEQGKTYIFYLYYGGKIEQQHFSGQVISYEHPLVKVKTKGLIRIVNCSSNAFIEAIARLHVEEIDESDLALESESKS